MNLISMMNRESWMPDELCPVAEGQMKRRLLTMKGWMAALMEERFGERRRINRWQVEEGSSFTCPAKLM